MILYFIIPVYLMISGCQEVSSKRIVTDFEQPSEVKPARVAAIQPPSGYKLSDVASGSFAFWLRNIRLKSGNQVFLYNGKLKANQSAQYAVLDIPVGKKDLQQCADAVMRLRASWLYDQDRYDEIVFKDYDSKKYSYKYGNDDKKFENYLEQVFGMCGTASLEKMMRSVRNLNDLKAGDVWIKGGFPGHAMIVIQVAENQKGEKAFLLAQSYMPAQDIHIVKNPEHPENPWYFVHDIGNELKTPEWNFSSKQLKSWQ